MLAKSPVTEFDTNWKRPSQVSYWPFSQVSYWPFSILTPCAARECAALFQDLGQTLSFTTLKATSITENVFPEKELLMVTGLTPCWR
jgi:hypothetical protein